MTQTVDFVVRRAERSDLAPVSAMIEAAFGEQFAFEYAAAAQTGFRMYVAERALAKRLDAGSWASIATDFEGQIAGYIELRGRGDRHDPKGRDHIALMFVGLGHQGCGLSYQLLGVAIDEAVEAGHRDLTIHASPYARPIYKRHGFQEVPEPLDRDGSIATAMRLDISSHAHAVR